MSKKNLSYKEAIDEVEEIMQYLEQDDIEIDDLSTKVKRASELIAYCKTKLRKSEEEIEHILNEMKED